MMSDVLQTDFPFNDFLSILPAPWPSLCLVCDPSFAAFAVRPGPGPPLQDYAWSGFKLVADQLLQYREGTCAKTNGIYRYLDNFTQHFSCFFPCSRNAGFPPVRRCFSAEVQVSQERLNEFLQAEAQGKLRC